MQSLGIETIQGRNAFNMSNDMIGSIDDLGSLANQLDSSCMYVDIDTIFNDDVANSSESRQKQYQSMMQASLLHPSHQSQNHANMNHRVPNAFNTKLSMTIPEDDESQWLPAKGFSTMAPVDRTSTLGSFSISSFHSLENFPVHGSHNVLDSQTMHTNLGSDPKFEHEHQLERTNVDLDSLSNLYVVNNGKLNQCERMINNNSNFDAEMMNREFEEILKSSVQTSYDFGSESGSGNIMEPNTLDELDVANLMMDAGSGSALTIVPNENDVLLGRGGRNNQWSGNDKLRQLALDLSTVYSTAPKRNKPAIAWTLVLKMRGLQPPSRFLKQDQAAGEWSEVDDDVAREKASQCLRDIVASRAKVRSPSEIGSTSMSYQSLNQATWAFNDEFSTRNQSTTNVGGFNEYVASKKSTTCMNARYLDAKRQISSAPDMSKLMMRSSDSFSKRRKTALTDGERGTANATFGMPMMQQIEKDDPRSFNGGDIIYTVQSERQTLPKYSSMSTLAMRTDGTSRCQMNATFNLNQNHLGTNYQRTEQAPFVAPVQNVTCFPQHNVSTNGAIANTNGYDPKQWLQGSRSTPYDSNNQTNRVDVIQGATSQYSSLSQFLQLKTQNQNNQEGSLKTASTLGSFSRPTM